MNMDIFLYPNRVRHRMFKHTLALSTHSKPCIICDIVNHYYRRSADVHITVQDVNEFIPEWSQEEYSGQVEEGEIAEVILQVPNTHL